MRDILYLPTPEAAAPPARGGIALENKISYDTLLNRHNSIGH